MSEPTLRQIIDDLVTPVINEDDYYPDVIVDRIMEIFKETCLKVIGEDEKERHTDPIDSCRDCIAVRHGQWIKEEQRARLEQEFSD